MTRPSLLGRFFGTPFVALLMFVGYGLLGYGWYTGHVAWWLALATVGAAMRTISAVRYLRHYKAWDSRWQAMGRMDATPQSSDPKRATPGGWLLPCFAVLVFIGIPAYVGLRHEKPMNTQIVVWAVSGLYLLVRLALDFFRSALVRVIFALLIAAAVPVYLHQQAGGNQTLVGSLTGLWLVAVIYLAFKIVRGLVRRLMRASSKSNSAVKQSVSTKAAAATKYVAWELGRASGSPSRGDAEKSLPEYAARVLANGKTLPEASAMGAFLPSGRK